LLEPTIEALAALDALSSILADAKSGDLANEETPLEPGAVLAWLKGLRSQLELEPVEELIEELFEEPAPMSNSVAQDLADLLSHEHVISVDLAARILGQPSESILELGRRSNRYVLLEGPPALLLDMAGVGAEQEVAS
jgi:hypothetical protein